jgi:hypothetical protein
MHLKPQHGTGLLSTGAHARSLLHYETHLRNAHTGGLNAAALRNTYYQDQEVIFLQVRFVSARDMPVSMMAAGCCYL